MYSYPSFANQHQHHHHYHHYDTQEPTLQQQQQQLPVPGCFCCCCEHIRINSQQLSPPISQSLHESNYYQLPQHRNRQQQPGREFEQSNRNIDGFVDERKYFFERLHCDEFSEDDENWTSPYDQYNRPVKPAEVYRPKSRKKHINIPSWLKQKKDRRKSMAKSTRRNFYHPETDLETNRSRIDRVVSQESVSDMEYIKRPNKLLPFNQNEHERHVSSPLQKKEPSSSRYYLHKAQIVTSRKEEWEQRIVNSGQLYSEISQRRKSERTPLPFTSSTNSETEIEEENEIQAVEQQQQQQRLKVNETQRMSTPTTEEDLNIQTNGSFTDLQELEQEISVHDSISSPTHRQEDLKIIYKAPDPIKQGKRLSKSVPAKGHFKHPELEELNLSGMRINDSNSNSNSNNLANSTTKVNDSVVNAELNEPPTNLPAEQEQPVEFKQGSSEHILMTKHFRKWKNYRKKYKNSQAEQLERKQQQPIPKQIQGFQVLSHSRSHQNLTNYKNLRKEEDEVKFHRARSTIISRFSVPAQPQPNELKKKWYNLFDSINPWVSKDDELQPELPEVDPIQVEEEELQHNQQQQFQQHSNSIENVYQPSSSSGVMDVEFAMEIDGKMQMDHATAVYCNNNEILHKISKDYDSLTIAKPKKESLTIQNSELIYNTSVENLTDKPNNNNTTKSKTYKRNSIISNNKHYYYYCQVCHENLQDSTEQIMEVKGRQLYWHLSCFRCTQCGLYLGTDDHYFHNDKLYCLQHFVEIAHVPKCAACSEYILDNICTLAMGLYWHKDHLQCVHCKKALIGTKFVKCGETLAMCFDCQQKLYSKKCTFCKKKILPTEVYVRSGDYYWHANDSCIKCQTCSRNLRDSYRVFIKNDKTYCNRYCAQMYISPAETTVA